MDLVQPRALPHPGPAVGHGIDGGVRRVGENLEAAWGPEALVRFHLIWHYQKAANTFPLFPKKKMPCHLHPEQGTKCHAPGS